jgi:hypothetical protein
MIFLSAFQQQVWDNTSNWATTVFFHVLSSLLFTTHLPVNAQESAAQTSPS